MQTRTLRIYLNKGEKKIVAIDLLSGQGPNTKLPPLKKVSPEKLWKTPSICTWYLSETNDGTFCDRLTLFDDLMFADEVMLVAPELQSFGRRGELDAFRSLVARLSEPEASKEIEDFYSAHAGEQSVAHLNSLHNLLLGDCPRVRSIFLDNSGNVAIAEALVRHVAVCAELQNKVDLATKMLEERSQNALPDPGISFTLSRLVIRKNKEKAKDLATRCLSDGNPRAPCQQIMLMIAQFEGKKYKLKGINNEDTSFKNFLAIEEGLPAQQESLYLNQVAQLPAFPQSLENYLLIAWINAAHDPALIDDFYLRSKIQVSSIQGGSTLDKVIESIEKRNMTKLLPTVYLRKLRSMPEDPNLWYRLVRSYGKAEQCPELLKGMKQGAKYLPKYNASLLQMEGSCLIELNRLPEALETYKKILDVKPNSWSSHFNLANVYERLGKNEDAFVHFQKTLQFQPPQDVKDSVQQKVNQLRPPKGASSVN